MSAAVRLPLPRRIGLQCAVHVHWSMAPLELHHVWPLGKGGPDIAANRVLVCANGHSMIHSLMDRMFKAGTPQVPWAVRRRYGRRVRALALLGYQRSTLQRMDVT